jgi:hypothetical protein
MSAIIQTLYTILQSDAAQRALQGLAAAGTQQLAQWIGQHAQKENIELPAEKADAISHLILSDPTFWEKLLTIFKPKDKRGILIVGPSGAGKTALINSLNNREDDDAESTVEIDPHLSLLAGRMAMVRDAPGQIHYASKARLWEAVASIKPKILIVVVAGGYLDSKGTGDDLKRSDPSTTPPFKSYASLKDFLEATRREELTWLTTFKNLVQVSEQLVNYVVLIVNKKEIWLNEEKEILDLYRTGNFASELQELTKKIAVTGQQPQILSVTARYNAFKSQVPPVATFDRKAALSSIRLLKAFLAALLVDGNIN